MITSILTLHPGDREKFKEVVSITNRSKNCNIEIKKFYGREVEINHQSINEIWILGRVFQPYELPMGNNTFKINMDNSYIDRI